MKNEKTKEVAVIVAHPDDETLWAGGTLLNHPEWNCFIVSLCRKSDSDRAPKFYKALNELHSEGTMGDLDDGSEQLPLQENIIEELIQELLPSKKYDYILTHNPLGEYTRHLRHEEIGAAVMRLWFNSRLSSEELWIFAYEDGARKYFPKALITADIYFELSDELWKQKYKLITGTYGFGVESWEAKTIPKSEAFWRYTKKGTAIKSHQEKHPI